VAAVTGQWRDLLDPLLLLVTTLLVARTASGIWARQRGNRLPLRGREELLWGLLVTAGLHVSYTIAALPPQDAWVGLAILLGMGSTALCGGAGIRASRVGGSIEAGCYASVATLTIGLMLWLISLPLMIVLLTWSMSGAIPTIHALSHLAVPTGHPSTFWLQNLHVVPKYFPLLMLTGVTGGFFGAVCGYSPIVDESEQRRLAALSDAKPRGTCAGCGAQAWEDTTTCWSCGRRIVV
jgi:hypothetical protein